MLLNIYSSIILGWNLLILIERLWVLLESHWPEKFSQIVQGSLGTGEISGLSLYILLKQVMIAERGFQERKCIWLMDQKIND